MCGTRQFMMEHPAKVLKSSSTEDFEGEVLAYQAENPNETLEQLRMRFRVRKSTVRDILETAGRKTRSQLARLDPLSERIPKQPYIDVRAILRAKDCQLVVLAVANVDEIEDCIERGLAIPSGEHLPLSPLSQDRLRMAAFCQILSRTEVFDTEPLSDWGEWFRRIPCENGEKLLVIAAVGPGYEKLVKSEIRLQQLTGFFTSAPSIAGPMSHLMLSPELNQLGLGTFPSLALVVDKLSKSKTVVFSAAVTHSALRLRILASTAMAESGVFWGKEHGPTRSYDTSNKKFRRQNFTIQILTQRAIRLTDGNDGSGAEVPLAPVLLKCDDVKLLPPEQKFQIEEGPIVGEIEVRGVQQKAIVFNSETFRSLLYGIVELKGPENILDAAQRVQDAFLQRNSGEPLIECARLLNFTDHWSASIRSLLRLVRLNRLPEYESALFSCLIVFLLDAQFCLKVLNCSGKWEVVLSGFKNSFMQIVDRQLRSVKGMVVGEVVKKWKLGTGEHDITIKQAFDLSLGKVLERESRLLLPLVLSKVAQVIHAEIASISQSGLSSVPLTEVVKNKEFLGSLGRPWPIMWVHIDTLINKLRYQLRSDYRDEIGRERREKRKSRLSQRLDKAPSKNGKTVVSVAEESALKFSAFEIGEFFDALGALPSDEARFFQLKTFENEFFSKKSQANYSRGGVFELLKGLIEEHPLGDMELESALRNYVKALEFQNSRQIDIRRKALVRKVASARLAVSEVVAGV